MKKYNIHSLFDLTGKVAVVTCASEGIGKDVAILLAHWGADVALIARNKEKLEKVSKEVSDIGRKSLPFPFDLVNTENIPEMMKEVNDHFGKIDILINNAGVNIPKVAEDITPEDWDKQMDINLKSVFFATQAAGKYMKQQKRGKIINVSSQMAFVGYYKRAAYSTSKGGITQMTKTLSVEWAAHHININTIAPTFIETPITSKMIEDEVSKNDVLGRNPLGTLAK